MKYALILPVDSTELWSIVQVDVAPFSITPPLFWKECEDNVSSSTHNFNSTTQEITPIQVNNTEYILFQIQQIEKETLMNRAAREGWLFTIERFAMQDYAADLPIVQAGLYAGNPAYKRIKDIDNQIVALRAQL